MTRKEQFELMRKVEDEILELSADQKVHLINYMVGTLQSDLKYGYNLENCSVEIVKELIDKITH